MKESSPFAVLELGKGRSLSLGPEGDWRPSGEGLSELAEVANLLSRPPLFRHSPADGDYLTGVARQVAGKLGGRLKLDNAAPRHGSVLPGNELVL